MRVYDNRLVRSLGVGVIRIILLPTFFRQNVLGNNITHGQHQLSTRNNVLDVRFILKSTVFIQRVLLQYLIWSFLIPFFLNTFQLY